MNTDSISRTNITFKLNSDIQKYQQMEYKFENGILYPEDYESLVNQPCQCEGKWKSRPHKFVTGASIWGLLNCYTVDIFALSCTYGNCIKYYQGNQHGVFYHSRYILFSYSFLWNYLLSALTSGTTFYGFCKQQNLLSHKVMGVERQLDPKTFSTAFINFASLCSEDSDLTFVCKLCGIYPKVFGFDGTDLGFPKKWSTLQSLKSDTCM
jgi:hypothetical protein